VPVTVPVMSRIRYVQREELGPEGQQLWDGLIEGLGDLVTADGGLAGPFNAFVTAPGVGRRVSALGQKLRFGTSIERRLSEIAIITVGARWQAEFEWWAHAPMAREHGVADAVVAAIGRGQDPPAQRGPERREVPGGGWSSGASN
jgi:4-carboxymuconolactone decarboxylase